MVKQFSMSFRSLYVTASTSTLNLKPNATSVLFNLHYRCCVLISILKNEMWVFHYLSCLAQFISILHDVDEQEVEQLHVGRVPEN